MPAAFVRFALPEKMQERVLFMEYSFAGHAPDTAAAAFVAASAELIGNVALAEGASIWYGAVLRGDDGSITIGKNSNVQDNSVLHSDPGGQVALGENVTIGHSALIHGCTVGDGSLIGMHATLLNHCAVGRGCIIGAGALVPEGMVVPDGMIAVGVPAKLLHPASAAQQAHSLENAAHYVQEALRHAAAQKARQPQ